ncbi:hypothetical protein NDU88_005482 [Pleurodeles waltl]|uniref:Uncharacterized protein n=1 Tax=Pleurodeles waltl TaxID=8319 RepID=A0AAV7NMP2_PLEWA|nr:hypothetical protein NDU88_005482 [Pleurodeles waltl]
MVQTRAGRPGCGPLPARALQRAGSLRRWDWFGGLVEACGTRGRLLASGRREVSWSAAEECLLRAAPLHSSAVLDQRACLELPERAWLDVVDGRWRVRGGELALVAAAGSEVIF